MSRKIRPCALLVAFFALAPAMTATSALAEEGFLPGTLKGFTFKSTSAKVILETEKKSKIACESLQGSGTGVTDKHAEHVSFDLDGCKALGFSIVSLGDKEDLILGSNGSSLVCLLSGGGFGLILEPNTELHLEVPAIPTLILIRGSMIARLEPVGTEPTTTFSTTASQSGAGKQAITACSDKVNHKLEMSTGEGAFEPASLTGMGTTTGEEAETLMGS